MPVTMKEVLAELDKDEPDYTVFELLGPEALPHLEQIVDADDPLRAAKAAYAASVISSEASIDVLTKAARHADPQVRVAVAHGLRNAAEAPTNAVLEQLLDDGDVGVRKLALGAAGDLNRSELRAKVASMAEADPVGFVRDAATDAAGKID